MVVWQLSTRKSKPVKTDCNIQQQRQHIFMRLANKAGFVTGVRRIAVNENLTPVDINNPVVADPKPGIYFCLCAAVIG